MIVSIAEYKANADDKNFFYTLDGRLLDADSPLPTDDVNALVHKHFRLRGGKGGFGSMLRAIGNQIEKTTNHEMCRDLSGRRMRDVNAEEKLKSWYSKANDREKEKLDRYLEKQKKRRETLEKGPLHDHKFNDPDFHQRKEKISHELDAAVQFAIKRIATESVTNEASSSSSTKRSRLWIETIDKNSGCSSDSSFSLSESDCEINVGTKLETESLHPLTDCETQPTKCSPTISELEKDAIVDKSPTPNETLVTETLSKVSVQGITEEELSNIKSVEELEEQNPDCLKQALYDRGLKCGGTSKERAIRLFSVRNLSANQYPEKLKAKPVKPVFTK